MRDYYVGVRINNPDPHYGWVRLRHNGTTDYIKDFAMENSMATEITTPDLFNHIAPAAQHPVLTADAGTNALHIQFDAASGEDSLMEYRVILRNTIYTDSMTATKCEITQPGHYISVMKTGGPYSVDLSPLTTDWAGNILIEGQTYKAYIYSRCLGRRRLNRFAQPSCA